MILNFDHGLPTARGPPKAAFLCKKSLKAEVNPIAKKENIVTFSVPFPADRYEALLVHARKRGEKVEDYMTKSLESWYRKIVPGHLRKYFDEKYEMEFGTTPEPLNIPTPGPEDSTDLPLWES